MEGILQAKLSSEKLDDLINLVAKMDVFVDYQSLKIDDQSISCLANKLKNENRVEALKQIIKSANRKSNNVEHHYMLKMIRETSRLKI